MTWKKIKQAAAEVGIEETDEIYSIQCERRDGAKSFHKADSGKLLRLREKPEETKADVRGCAS